MAKRKDKDTEEPAAQNPAAGWPKPQDAAPAPKVSARDQEQARRAALRESAPPCTACAYIETDGTGKCRARFNRTGKGCRGFRAKG